ncbi:MAG: type II toxin-antitoxin system VapC family toxin [bacterium]
MSLFLDTSFLYALEDSSDQHHQEAIGLWQKILKNPPQLILTSYIFDEITTLLQSKLGHAKATEAGNRLLQSALVEILHVTSELFQEAWAYFNKHKDKGYSFTDCVSFAAMNQRSIKNALSFDKHFRQAGFKISSF